MRNGKTTLSNRGRLVGHRWTALEWVAAAKARWSIAIPETEYLALVHTLTATHGAPQWMGLRSPSTPEAGLLSTADKLSGNDALMVLCQPPGGGWGQHHPHLKRQPFYLPAQPAKSLTVVAQ